MLEALAGNKTAASVLLYMQAYGEGYGNDIARTFGIYPTAVQQQLKRLEDGGILVNKKLGRTRLYTWNPRNPLVKELRPFLNSVLDSLPESEIRAYYRARKRPRKAGKAL